jgi:methyltransferase (TIGR00027 family)
VPTEDVATSGRGTVPDPTAVWVALWRALHVEFDPPPHVLHDTLSAELADPTGEWRHRSDMVPRRVTRARASILARSRLVEDLVVERAARGVDQYVILGAGLDTFAQRRTAAAVGVCIFEIDHPETQAWKRRRLDELGYVVSESLRFVPVDFEADDDWWARLVEAGFDPGRPAVVALMGVVGYLTRRAITGTLERLAGLAPGSTLVMSFLLPLDLTEVEERHRLEVGQEVARAAGTPFVSLFSPEHMVALVRAAGFADVQHVAAGELTARYFAGRTDGLRPSSSEELIVATTS